MKKISLLSIAFIAISFASCKKDRTCNCTVTDNSPGSTSSEYKVVYKKITKSNAKTACMSLEVTPTGQPYTETRKCTLN
jgi:hypothetical protein